MTLKQLLANTRRLLTEREAELQQARALLVKAHIAMNDPVESMDKNEYYVTLKAIDAFLNK